MTLFLAWGLFPAALACVATDSDLNCGLAEGREILLVQSKTRTIRPARLPRKAEEVLQVIEQPEPSGNAVQRAFSERLLSRVNFYRAGFVDPSGDSRQLVEVLIVAFVLGLTCLACMFYEYKQEAEDYRDYQQYSRDISREKQAKSPLLQASVDRTSSQMTSPGFQNRIPTPPTFKKPEKSNAQAPGVSASSPLQDPSGVATEAERTIPASTIRPALTQHERHAPATPSSPSSLGRQTPANGAETHFLAENATAGKLVPLCSGLVLNVRSCFKVAFDHLDIESGSVPILAESSSKVLLLAHINEDADHNGGSVSVSLAEGTSSLGAITCVGGGVLKLTDRSNSVYGDMISTGQLQYKLVTGGKEVAEVNYQHGGNSTGNVHLIATSGALLAEASKHVNDDAKEGEVSEYLVVTVDKGVDSVLALLCILGAMILG